MQLFRRSVFRATSSTSSFLTKSRSIQTSTPFAFRSRVQASVASSVFRRAYSAEIDAADNEHKLVESAVQAAETTAEASPTYAFGNSDQEPPSNRNGRSRFAGSGPTNSRNITPGPSIYVGNLLFDITDADLAKAFEKFGPIKRAAVASDVRGLSKGFGYVDFETEEQATAAVEAMNQAVFEGRRLTVNYVAKARAPAQNNPPSKTLFIGNLAFEMSDADLNKLFRDVRNVIDVRVAIDRRTGQPRGFAHADFIDTESAIKGLEQLQGKELYGRALRCDYSTSTRVSRTPQEKL